MPTLKIGCRVAHKDAGEAVLKDYRAGSSKPWLLKTRSGLVWASHNEFCSAGIEPIRYAAAKPDKHFVKAGSLSGMFSAVFRPRGQITSHV